MSIILGGYLRAISLRRGVFIFYEEYRGPPKSNFYNVRLQTHDHPKAGKNSLIKLKTTVDWDWRIHRMHLCVRVRANPASVLHIKQSDSEDPVMLEF